MTRPLPSGKKSVSLTKPEVRVSKIRRDPPPVAKELVVHDPEERDQRNMIIGVTVFTLAVIVILIGFMSMTGWTPAEYILRFKN